MDLKRAVINDWDINTQWSLFLDRDGVINYRLPGNYVKDPEEFVFLDGVLDAIRIFSDFFRYIFIVTNQQGIAKGLMTVEELQTVHEEMLREITNKQGRIDNVYFAPDMDGVNPYMRKPGPGMALMAKKQHEDVEFSRSIMIGDSLTDMEFARNLGMKSIFINPAGTNDKDSISTEYDIGLASLSEFAGIIQDIIN